MDVLDTNIYFFVLLTKNIGFTVFSRVSTKSRKMYSEIWCLLQKTCFMRNGKYLYRIHDIRMSSFMIPARLLESLFNFYAILVSGFTYLIKQETKFDVLSVYFRLFRTIFIFYLHMKFSPFSNQFYFLLTYETYYT